MIGKDYMGLIEFLKKEMNEVYYLRKTYEDVEDKTEFTEKRLKELGVKLSEYRYNIRNLEESEVTIR